MKHVHIGSNFSLDSKEFLDDRIGQAKTTEDLKEWNKDLPEGFEICLDGVWYYYDSSYNSEETGHFVKRVAENLLDDEINDKARSASLGIVKNLAEDLGELEGSVDEINASMNPISILNIISGPVFTSTEELDDDLREKTEDISTKIANGVYDEDLDIDKDGELSDNDISLWSRLYNSAKPTISYNPAGTSSTYWLEIGSAILPKITWSVVSPKITWALNGTAVVWKIVEGTDKNYITPETSTVTGESSGIIGENKTSWEGNQLITSGNRKTFTYKIKSISSEGQEVEASAYFKFAYKTYTGSTSIDLWNKSQISQSDLIGFSRKYTESGTLSSTGFNCSGGKYPYILIPTEFYRSAYKTYVSGNLNSDFLIKDVIVINERGTALNYKMYRTNYIQTGSNILIEIK